MQFKKVLIWEPPLPNFQIPATKWASEVQPWRFKIPQQMGFEKSQICAGAIFQNPTTVGFEKSKICPGPIFQVPAKTKT